MTSNLSRRRFLQIGAVAAGTGLAVSGADAGDAPPVDAPKLSAYQDGPQVWACNHSVQSRRRTWR